MPKFKIVEYTRPNLEITDELKYILEHYSEKTFTKAIQCLIKDHFEIINLTKKLKKKLDILEKTNEHLLEKIKNN